MARKREERAARDMHKRHRQKQAYLAANDGNFAGFAGQLAKLGLQIREIPGDGNCLFRALGDQFIGHGRNHLQHRHEVVEYIRVHRPDFEPFVEDDMPFEKYVAELTEAGTYGGNDAIVAFARLHKVNVVIHQFELPIWKIEGSTAPGTRELHISYHNGDHYSSVRHIGDMSEKPNNIVCKNMPADASNPHNHNGKLDDKYYNSYMEDYDYKDSEDDQAMIAGLSAYGSEGFAMANVDDDFIITEIAEATNCKEELIIREALRACCNNKEKAIECVLDQMGSQHLVSWDSNSSQPASECSSSSESHACAPRQPASAQRQKSAGRDRKRNNKLAKKQRAEERRRAAALGQNLPEPAAPVLEVLTEHMHFVQI